MKLSKRRLISAVPWAGFEATATAAISAVSLLTIVAAIGPEAFGRATLAMVTAGLIEAALAGGLFDAVVRARSSHTKLIDTIFWTRLALGMMACLCSIAAGMALASVYDDPQLGSLLSVFAISCVLNALAETPSALLTRRYRFRRLAAVAIASRMTGLVVGAVAAFSGLGSWSLISAGLTANALAAALYWTMAPRLPRLQLEVHEIGPILRFSYLVGAETLLVTLAGRGVLFFFGYFHGLHALGYFNFGLRLVEEVGGVLGRVAWKSAFPYFSEVNRRGDSLGSAFAQATAIYAAAAFPVLAGIAFVAPDVIPLAFNMKWLAAIPIVQVVAIATMLATSATLAGPLLRTMGRQAALLCIAALDTAIALSASLATAHSDPITATAVWSAKAVVVAPTLVALVVQATGMPVTQFFRSIGPAAVATLFMALALWGTELAVPEIPSHLRIVVSVVAGVLFYVSALLAIDGRVRRYAVMQSRGALAGLLRSQPGQQLLKKGSASPPQLARAPKGADTFLTIVVPVLNERRYIASCLRSLLEQIDPSRSEIIVIDGGSQDSTLQIVSEMAARYPVIRILQNSKRIQSAAVNLGARSASPRSTLIMRADAHAEYPPGFVAACIRDLQESHATSVVVPMTAIGRSCFQRAVAAAQNSWIGNGGSRHRSLAQSGFVTHGHHALFDRQFFQRLGGYDESFTHNEDAEYDHRLRIANGKIWMSAVPVLYFPRETIRGLARQYYNHGRGRARTLFAHSLRPALRQLLPPAILVVNLVAVPLALARPGFVIVPLLYAAGCGLMGFWLAIRLRDICAGAAGLAAIVMHMSWGAGFIVHTLAASLRYARSPADDAPRHGRPSIFKGTGSRCARSSLTEHIRLRDRITAGWKIARSPVHPAEGGPS
jgi:succinoglycan biosynthesis protein ExoA